MPLRAKDPNRFEDQLSLFTVSQICTEASLAAIVRAAAIPDVRLSPAHQPNDPPSLDQPGSPDGRNPQSGGAAAAGAPAGERTDARNPLSTHDGAENGLQRGSRDRDERVGFGAEPVSPLTALARDFRFPSQLAIGNGTLQQKTAANLEAIRLLKAIERQQRLATHEEKLTLVRYTGWGALPQVFHPLPGEWQNAATELKQLL